MLTNLNLTMVTFSRKRKPSNVLFLAFFYKIVAMYSNANGI